MIQRLRNIDRQMALGIGVLIAALFVFSAGALGIYVTLADDPVDLPSEGTIADIVGTASDTATDENGLGEVTLPTQQPDSPPPPPPTRLLIPSLYIDAPIITKGVLAGGAQAGAIPEVPDRPDQVAWYPPTPDYPGFSSHPGRTSNSVFSGHVDWQTQSGAPIPGVFYRLREMKIGQVVEVVLEDGARLQYRVTGNVATKYDDPEVSRVMERTDREVITLITCGGSWVSSSRSENGGNYSHRIIVRAERMRALAGGPGTNGS
jgi:LPXTG-site transpeptidase (sortase) family protein